jgi:biopolymer transport protein ExbD
MIDVVFLLIVFFTLIINFTAADQNERIKLPISELVQPPEQPPTDPVTLHVLAGGDVIYDGTDYSLQGLNDPQGLFAHHLRFLTFMNILLKDVTIIIRADAQCPTGQVLDVIELCQGFGLEKFVLRTRQQEAVR